MNERIRRFKHTHQDAVEYGDYKIHEFILPTTVQILVLQWPVAQRLFP